MHIDSSLMKIAEDGQEIPHPPEHLSGEHSSSSCEAVRGSSAETSKEPENIDSSSSSLEIILVSAPSIPSGLLTPDMTNSSNEGNANAGNADAGVVQPSPDTPEDQVQPDPSQAQARTSQAKETQGERGDKGDHADN